MGQNSAATVAEAGADQSSLQRFCAHKDFFGGMQQGAINLPELIRLFEAELDKSDNKEGATYQMVVTNADGATVITHAIVKKTPRPSVRIPH